jgi:CBS-domain-containing membrane protein
MNRRLESTSRQTSSRAPLTPRENARRQVRLQRFLAMQTKDVMTKLVLTVSRHVTLRELEHLFETHDFNGFPVVEGHHLLGIVTKFDFLKNFVFTPSTVFPHYDDLMKRTVGDHDQKRLLGSPHDTVNAWAANDGGNARQELSGG